MNHKKCQTIFWLALTLTLIGVLLLAWPPPTQAGPELPSRKPPAAAQPPDDDDIEPVGAHIVLSVPSAPAGVWTMVQWQDSAGGWHDIEGWQGPLDEGDQKMWWLAADLFDKGPFRWLVYQGQRGKLLAQSASFYLPTSAGETVEIEVSLGSLQPTSISNSLSALASPSSDGSYIELRVHPPQAGLWTIVQWQDSAGGWHGIEGWQGPLDEGSKKMWWLAPDLFGKGPFRWVVYQGVRGKLLVTSDSFYLPDFAGKRVQVALSLSE